MSMSGRCLAYFLSLVTPTDGIKSLLLAKCDLRPEHHGSSRQIIFTKASVDSICIKQRTLSMGGLTDLLCSLKQISCLYLQPGGDCLEIIPDSGQEKAKKRIKSVENMVCISLCLIELSHFSV